MKAQICPVCSGSGKYQEKSCHGCGGLGWVQVQDTQYIPYYPPVIYPYQPPKLWWETYPYTIWCGTETSSNKDWGKVQIYS